uniref:Uncharacterized protein n=1 Tax=Manihot esculenta TaxID=3983 RepID=A0A2C9WK45_MANES
MLIANSCSGGSLRVPWFYYVCGFFFLKLKVIHFLVVYLAVFPNIV